MLRNASKALVLLSYAKSWFCVDRGSVYGQAKAMMTFQALPCN
jgi:hypothetical protein